MLDHLVDSEGPQSVTEIIAGTALSRNAAEQAIFRTTQSGQIERVAPGTYRLAPPKPPPPPRPEPPVPAVGGRAFEDWMTLMDAGTPILRLGTLPPLVRRLASLGRLSR